MSERERARFGIQFLLRLPITIEMNPELANILDTEVDAEVAKLASSGIRIPPQPKLVLEVLAMATADDVDLRRLADLISQDAGLTALLYKLTRSAAFARARRASSIESILALIGIRQAALLVQSYGLTVATTGNAKVLEQFWMRSTCIAQLASIIVAERRGGGCLSPEQAYMTGIFHDCGVPVLMQRFPEYCKAAGVDLVARKWADVQAEDRAFSVDHCSIGYLLARHWRLPDYVAEAILHHHDCCPDEKRAVVAAVAVLQLAIELFSREYGLANPDWSLFEPLVIEEFGIHSDDLQEFCELVMDAFRS